MPEISLLQPTVLRGIVQKFTAPETLTMLTRVPKTPWPFPTAQWEVIRGSRAIARPNVPNSEAHVVPRLGRSQESAAFVYLREKKVFEPTTLYWLRQAAERLTDLNRTRAEEAIMREVGDLNQRFDNFAEYALWQSLTGRLVLDYPDVQADVDYKFLDSHKTTLAAGWDTVGTAQIISDIRAAKRLVQRDGRVEANEAYAPSEVLDAIFQSFAASGSAVLLSDRMKDSYYRTGILPGFMGLDWRPQDAVFDAVGAAYTDNPTRPAEEKRFLDQGRVIIGNFTVNRPLELIEGPTADFDAPEGFTGKFAKSFREPDPSALQHLLEWNFLPVVNRPEQFVSLSGAVSA